MRRELSIECSSSNWNDIVHFYRWLYYRCYRYSKRADSKLALHWANAGLYVLLFLGMNLLVVFLILVVISPAIFGVLFSGSKWLAGGLFAGVALVQLYFLRRNRRYENIVRQFSKETPDEQRRGDRLFAWYFVISFLLVVAISVAGIVRIGLFS